MKYIEKGWQSYAALLPKNASAIQIKETRQAFFGGAAILFETIMKIMDPGLEPTDADMEKMNAVYHELQEFGQSLDQRYLPTLRTKQ